MTDDPAPARPAAAAEATPPPGPAVDPRLATAPRQRAVQVEVDGLRAAFGDHLVLRDVSFTAQPNSVTAIIGPSGCGKSTLLRCINRMNDLIPGARVEGEVRLDGDDIYAPDVDPVVVRQRVGMVFQRPNPFPTMSIFDNVALAGLKLAGHPGRQLLDDVVERSLRRAALWDEVQGQAARSPA